MKRSAFARLPPARVLIVRTLLFAALWWILSEGEWRAAWLAALVVGAAVAASLAMWPARGGGVSPAGVAPFVAFFLWQSLRGGCQVAALALRPRLRLCPCVWLLPLRLAPGAGRILLADTMSLLPGTLSVGLEGDNLRLHVLDRALFAEADLRAAEARVAHLLGAG